MSNTKSDWRERVSYISPPTIEHAVCGQTQKFSPLSTPMLWKLRPIAPALGRAIAKFFAVYGPDVKAGDRTHSRKAVQAGEGAQVENRDEAITPELARVRMEQVESATTELISTLLDPKNAEILGSLIFDSAREVFPRGADMKEIKEFVETCDVGALVEWLTGVGKANQRVFAPLIEALTAKTTGEAVGGSSSPSTTKEATVPETVGAS